VCNAIHPSNLGDKFNDDQFVGDKADGEKLTQALNDFSYWGNASQAASDVAQRLHLAYRID
jgi:hypothetical protein